MIVSDFFFHAYGERDVRQIVLLKIQRPLPSDVLTEYILFNVN